MNLLATEPANLCTADTAAIVPTGLQPLLVCLSRMHAVDIPRSDYGMIAVSAEEEGYSSIHEKDTYTLQIFTTQRQRMHADLVEPEILTMDMDRREQLCSALLVVKLAATCSEANTAASISNPSVILAHEAIWMIVTSLGMNVYLNIARQGSSTADQQRHLSLLVVRLLATRLRKAVAAAVSDAAAAPEVVPSVCWMLCGLLTASEAVVSAVAHELVEIGMRSLHN